MAQIILGLFKDSKMAGQAISELKESGRTKEISVLAYDEKYQKPELHEVKKDATAGTAVGAAIGAVTGVLAGMLSGIPTVVVPGIGILVGGPLVTALGVTGGVLGSFAGGILGALIDLGINETTAQVYEKRIKAGEVLVGISAGDKAEEEVREILNRYGATDITTINK